MGGGGVREVSEGRWVGDGDGKKWYSRGRTPGMLGLRGENHCRWKRTAPGIYSQNLTVKSCEAHLRSDRCLSWASSSMLRCRSTAGDPLKPQRLGLLEVDGNLRRDAPSPRTIIRAIKQGPDRQSRSRSLYPPHRRSGPCPGKSVLQLFGWGSPVSQSGVLGGSERQTQRRQPRRARRCNAAHNCRPDSGW